MMCQSCREECDIVDSTISTTGRTKGQHTGDIYFCEHCGLYWLYNFLDGKIHEWEY